jgi:hypothetical protein
VNVAVGESLRANGSRPFDREGRPILTEKPVIQMLDFSKRSPPYGFYLRPAIWSIIGERCHPHSSLARSIVTVACT